MAQPESEDSLTSEVEPAVVELEDVETLNQVLAEEKAKNSNKTFTEEDTAQFLAFCKEQCEAGEVGEVCASGVVSVTQAAYGVGSTYGTNCKWLGMKNKFLCS